MKMRLRWPSPALAVACLALFVALGGTGYAITKINGSQLVNRSVAGTKIKKNALSKFEIKENSIVKATTVMDVRPGPVTAPFQGTFQSSGGQILIRVSGSGFSTIAGRVIGVDVAVDGIEVGQARVYANEANSHRAFVTSASPLVGLGSGVHTVSLTPRSGTSTDANDSFSVVVYELPVGLGTDRFENVDDAVAGRHSACNPTFDATRRQAATIWPAGDDDWWWSEWSPAMPGNRIEVRLTGGPRMDVYLWNTSTQLADNVTTFIRPSLTEWYDFRVDNPKGVAYRISCKLAPIPGPSPRPGGSVTLVRPGS
jgi:hypothetical protein